MQQVEFIYNTQVEELIIPEYGRNVQDLITHCKEIEDPMMRQKFAEAVVDLMSIMTPHNRNMDEHRKKLWHHFFRIAKYDIDVNPLFGTKPVADLDILKPERMEYPPFNDRMRHYGSFIHQLIEKCLLVEEGPKKEGFKAIIGSYMKMAYKNWNKEHYVNDEIIKSDLKTLSKGKLVIEEGVNLDTYVTAKKSGSFNSIHNNAGQNINTKKGNFSNKNKNFKNNKRRK